MLPCHLASCLSLLLFNCLPMLGQPRAQGQGQAPGTYPKFASDPTGWLAPIRRMTRGVEEPGQVTSHFKPLRTHSGSRPPVPQPFKF